jgi:hypothetical protein
MEFWPEMAATNCVGAEDNSQGCRHDRHPCLPDGAGFLKRVGDALGSRVLLNGVYTDNNDASLTLTTSWRVVGSGNGTFGRDNSILSFWEGSEMQY